METSRDCASHPWIESRSLAYINYWRLTHDGWAALVLQTKRRHEMKVEIGDRFDAYNDGKASPSRLVTVVVDNIIDRFNLNKKGQRIWRKALKEDFTNVFEGCCFYCGKNGLLDATKQFWDWNCDEFIVGHILNDKRTERDPMLFAKRYGGDVWYGVNWNYMLDVTGVVRRRSLKRWRTCASEMGQRMKWNAKTGEYDYFDLKSGEKVDK